MTSSLSALVVILGMAGALLFFFMHLQIRKEYLRLMKPRETASPNTRP